MSERNRLAILVLPGILWAVFHAGIGFTLDILVMNGKPLPSAVVTLVGVDNEIIRRLPYVLMVLHPTVVLSYVLMRVFLVENSAEGVVSAALPQAVAKLKKWLLGGATLWAIGLAIVILLPYSALSLTLIVAWAIFISHGALVASVYDVATQLHRDQVTALNPRYVSLSSFLAFQFLLFWGLVIPSAVFLRAKRALMSA